MGKNQSASNLTNVIQVSSTGNILFVSGSTTLMSISSSGAITTTGVISGSNALSASYAANADTLDGLDSTAFATTGAYSATSGSLYTVSSSAYATSGSLSATSGSLSAASGSFNTRVSALEVTGSALSSSILSVSSSAYATSGSLSAASGSFNSRVASLETYSTNLTAKTASFATTGSNTFIGSQVVSGSLTASGSITATGTITAQTLVVQTITSSVVYSSGSNVFGNSVGNTHQFTGSVLVTGSLTINGTANLSNGASLSDNLAYSTGVNSWYINTGQNGATLRLKACGAASGYANRSGALSWIDNVGTRSDILWWDDNCIVACKPVTLCQNITGPTATFNCGVFSGVSPTSVISATLQCGYTTNAVMTATLGNNSVAGGGGYLIKTIDRADNVGGGQTGIGFYYTSPQYSTCTSGNVYSLNKIGLYVDDIYSYYGLNSISGYNNYGIYIKGGGANFMAAPLGINCNQPAYNLDVNGCARFTTSAGTIATFAASTQSQIKITGNTNTSDVGLRIEANSQAWSVGMNFFSAAGGTDFMVFNGTAATIPFRINTSGNATFSNSIAAGTTFSWDGGIGALSYGSGYVTMETNTANAIQIKTNGTTALTIATNQVATFANNLCAPSIYTCTTTGLNTSLTNAALIVEQRYSDMTGGGDYQGGGLLFMQNNSGGATWAGGAITSTVGTTACTGGYPGGLAFWVKGASGGTGTSGITQAMRIDWSGRVGIGTTNPGQALTVNGTTQTNALIGKYYGVTCCVGNVNVTIIDTGLGIPNNATYMVSFTGNPAAAGGVYSWNEVGYVVVNSQYNGSTLTQMITYTKAAGGGTSVYPGCLLLYPYFLVGSSTECTQTGSNQPSGQIRLKFCGWSNSPGTSQTTYLLQLM